MRREKIEDKTAILFAILAGGVYRRWWWANFETKAAQAALRELWSPVLARLTPRELRDELSRWQLEHGETDPPTPEAFSDFVKPVHTPASRAGFAGIKAILEG